MSDETSGRTVSMSHVAAIQDGRPPDFSLVVSAILSFHDPHTVLNAVTGMKNDRLVRIQSL